MSVIFCIKGNHIYIYIYILSLTFHNYFSNVSLHFQLTCKPKGKKLKPEYCCSTFKRDNIGNMLGKYIHGKKMWNTQQTHLCLMAF